MMRLQGPGRLGLAWCLGSFLTFTSPALAATNFARAGVGGLDNGTIQYGDGTGLARIAVNSVPLALNKQARDAGGAVLPAGAGVRPDQEIWFVLWIVNPSAFPAGDVHIVDRIDETQFTYVPGSLSQCMITPGVGADDDAIWAAPWESLSDGIGGPDDVASVAETGGRPSLDRLTVGSVPEQSNNVLEIPPGALYAIRFQVRVY